MRAFAARALPALALLAFGIVQLCRHQPLWYDELYTAQVSQLPVSDIVDLARNGRGPTAYLPGVPPSYNAPYYALMHLWLRLPLVDTGATWLRVPSLLCAAGAVLVLTQVVRRLAGPLAGFVAGALTALSPLMLEQSVEARSYGPALLATALAALGLVRWLDGRERGLVLFGVAGAAAGLLHWFALPAIAGLALAGILLRRSRSLALVAVAAALPTLALFVLASSHDTVGSPTPPPVGWALPYRAVLGWTIDNGPCAGLLVALALVGLWRSPHRVLGGCWLLVPLALATAAEQDRPVFYPRYLLPGLLGLAVLAALGVTSLPRLRRSAVAVLLVLSVVLACGTVNRAPRERGPQLVEALAAQQRPGEPIVATDARAALALDQYVTRTAPRLRPDVILPPDDVPTNGAPRVWLARWTPRLPIGPVDDDAILAAGGYRLTQQELLRAVTGTLVVQQWDR